MYNIYCKLRDAKGCSDSDVAKATGITKSTFTDWNKGRSVPKIEKLIKIAEYFDVSLDYLILGINSRDYDIALDNDVKIQLENVIEILDNEDSILYDGNELNLSSENRQTARNALVFACDIFKQHI